MEIWWTGQRPHMRCFSFGHSAQNRILRKALENSFWPSHFPMGWARTVLWKQCCSVLGRFAFHEPISWVGPVGNSVAFLMAVFPGLFMILWYVWRAQSPKKFEVCVLDGPFTDCNSHSIRLNQFKIPWRRKCQPTPVVLPGKSHGQRSLVSYSPLGCKELYMTERLNSNC